MHIARFLLLKALLFKKKLKSEKNLTRKITILQNFLKTGGFSTLASINVPDFSLNGIGKGSPGKGIYN